MDGVRPVVVGNKVVDARNGEGTLRVWRLIVVVKQPVLRWSDTTP